MVIQGGSSLLCFRWTWKCYCSAYLKKNTNVILIGLFEHKWFDFVSIQRKLTFCIYSRAFGSITVTINIGLDLNKYNTRPMLWPFTCQHSQKLLHTGPLSPHILNPQRDIPVKYALWCSSYILALLFKCYQRHEASKKIVIILQISMGFPESQKVTGISGEYFNVHNVL